MSRIQISDWAMGKLYLGVCIGQALVSITQMVTTQKSQSSSSPSPCLRTIPSPDKPSLLWATHISSLQLTQLPDTLPSWSLFWKDSNVSVLKISLPQLDPTDLTSESVEGPCYYHTLLDEPFDGCD